MFFFFFS